MTALLPCPFCGNTEPEFERIGTPRQSCIVACGNCGARHESSEEGEDSGTSWNRRAQTAQAVPLLSDAEIEAAWYECDNYITQRAYFDAGVHWAQKAVRAKLGAGVPQWLPIETAPRGSGEDGPSSTTDPAYIEPPHLLLWTQEGIRVGYYDWYYHPGYGRGADPNEPAWRGSDGERLYGPTHWMPLPPPPIVGKEGS